MRWLVAALGTIGLAGGIYLGLEPRLRRPELRVALNLRVGDAADAALAAGVALALEDRDERAGRFRVKTAHQTHAPGRGVVPNPRAHTMMYGLQLPALLRAEGSDAPLYWPRDTLTIDAIRAWMAREGLTRLTVAPSQGIPIPGPAR